MTSTRGHWFTMGKIQREYYEMPRHWFDEFAATFPTEFRKLPGDNGRLLFRLEAVAKAVAEKFGGLRDGTEIAAGRDGTGAPCVPSAKEVE